MNYAELKKILDFYSDDLFKGKSGEKDSSHGKMNSGTTDEYLKMKTRYKKHHKHDGIELKKLKPEPEYDYARGREPDYYGDED